MSLPARFARPRAPRTEGDLESGSWLTLAYHLLPHLHVIHLPAFVPPTVAAPPVTSTVVVTSVPVVPGRGLMLVALARVLCVGGIRLSYLRSPVAVAGRHLAMPFGLVGGRG